jgi:hypothetical protein
VSCCSPISNGDVIIVVEKAVVAYLLPAYSGASIAPNAASNPAFEIPVSFPYAGLDSTHQLLLLLELLFIPDAGPSYYFGTVSLELSTDGGTVYNVIQTVDFSRTVSTDPNVKPDWCQVAVPFGLPDPGAPSVGTDLKFRFSFFNNAGSTTSINATEASLQVWLAAVP